MATISLRIARLRFLIIQILGCRGHNNRKTMNHSNSPGSRSRWPWVVGAACGLILLIVLLLRRGDEKSTRSADSASGPPMAGGNSSEIGDSLLRRAAKGKGALTAEEIVAGKVKQFARSRREFVRAMARRANKEVPGEVERFFDALEAGNWDEVKVLYKGFADRSG